MRIGIDVRAATSQQYGGFKTYSVGLVKALARIDERNDYFLYVDRPDGFATDLPSNFISKRVSGKAHLIGAGWREQWAVPSWIRRDRVDISHFPSNTGPLRLSSGLIVTLHDVISLNHQIPSLPNMKGSTVHFALQVYSKFVIPRVAIKAKAVITVSQFAKKQIAMRLRIPAERIHVTHLAPDATMAPVRPAMKPNLRDYLVENYGITKPYLLGVGHEPHKNLERLVEAFQILRARWGREISLTLIVAHEPARSRLRQLVSKEGLNSSVRLLGSVTQQDLVRIYGLAEAFIFPSLEEGFGLPPLEAMACGTPVIASNHSAIPEIVGDAALMVTPIDALEIAISIQRVLENPGLAADLRDRGLRRAAQFSWESTARKTIEIYEAVHEEDRYPLSQKVNAGIRGNGVGL